MMNLYKVKLSILFTLVLSSCGGGGGDGGSADGPGAVNQTGCAQLDSFASQSGLVTTSCDDQYVYVNSRP